MNWTTIILRPCFWTLIWILCCRLSTLLKISKNAGPLLRPHIAVLVTALLEAVSGLEPQVMNYFSLRIAGSEEAQERVGVQILFKKTQLQVRYCFTVRCPHSHISDRRGQIFVFYVGEQRKRFKNILIKSR